MVQGLGSRRGHGSKQALFQPMFALEFEGLESPRMQMHRFGEVHSGIVFRTIPFDVRKSTIAMFMAEVLYRLVRESEANAMLFDFVWGSVEALDEAADGVANFHLWFSLESVPLLGLLAPGTTIRPTRGSTSPRAISPPRDLRANTPYRRKMP